MGGADNWVAPDATAFAHRSERFLLEHATDINNDWVNHSWSIAHRHGSGRVYPNFPDPARDGWATEYHGHNLTRLGAALHAYDPDRFFHFPQPPAKESAPFPRRRSRRTAPPEVPVKASRPVRQLASCHLRTVPTG